MSETSEAKALKRYAIHEQYGIVDKPDGQYVLYADVSAHLARCARMEEAAEELIAVVEKLNMSDRSFDFWNRALERYRAALSSAPVAREGE